MDHKDYSKVEVLLKQLKNGNESAYRFLYKTYYAELCGYIMALGGNRTMAQDTVQQTFIKLWDRRDKLSIKYSLKGYIFRMAYNQYMDTQKKRKKELNLLEELKHEMVIDFVEASHDDFDTKIKLLEVEINRLPEQCKNVFLLGKREGLKYKEIAKKLGISIKTVEIHMSKAHKRLRKKLKAKFKVLVLFITFY